MKVLVFSDSHSSLRFMRACILAVRPDVLIHLGDYYGDGAVIAGENPDVPFYGVQGNCDRYRCTAFEPEQIMCRIGSVQCLLTHGHRYAVKSGLGALTAYARACGAQIALYGHTHIPDCHVEPDGLWLVNPGSCGFGRTAALITLENAAVKSCRILCDADLEGKA